MYLFYLLNAPNHEALVKQHDEVNIQCEWIMEVSLAKECVLFVKNKLIEHSELQDKICNMIIIKQFANNPQGFDIEFRPFFED